MRHHRRPRPTPDDRVDGHDPREDETIEDVHHQVPIHETGRRERDLSRTGAGKDDVVGRGKVLRDLRAGVAHADDERTARRELSRIAIRPGIHLTDALVEALREGGDARHLVVRHRDNHLASGERGRLAADDKSVPSPGQAVDPHATPHRKTEARSVRLEEVGHGVLRRPGVLLSRKFHPVKPVVTGGREEAETVPAIAPGIPDVRSSIQYEMLDAPFGQMVRDRQPRLAATDHDDVDILCRVHPRTIGIDAPSALRQDPPGWTSSAGYFTPSTAEPVRRSARARTRMPSPPLVTARRASQARCSCGGRPSCC